MQNYWKPQDVDTLTNLQSYSGPSVILPDDDKLQPSQQGTIPILYKLSAAAQQATVLTNLRSSSLISLGQICDDNCTILLDNKKLVAAKTKNVTFNVKPDDIIMEGYRNPIDGLYDIPILKTTIQHNNFQMPSIHVNRAINQVVSNKIEHKVILKNEKPHLMF